MPHQVTLKEVAARAGVSYQTVSKVLNKQIQVSKETEERIRQAVEALGYRPNLIARNMRQQRTRLIGYSWQPAPPDHGNAILDLFLQSMAQAAEGAGYHLLCFPHRSEGDVIAAYRDLIETHRVDGFVISSVEFDDERVRFLRQQNFPFVAFGRSNPEWDFPCVDVDGADGMRQVVEHLLHLGHRQIAALAWPEDSRVGQNRMEGYRAALQAAGIAPRPEWIQRGPGVVDFGQAATARLLDLPAGQRPSAIVAFNDIMAIGAMRAAETRGLRVGADVAITGFDDHPMVQYLRPSLTSVRQPVWEIGQRVMMMLLDVLDDRLPQTACVLIPPRLIVRQSSGGPIT